MNGLKALAYQARRTLQLWTGLQVPPEEFLETIRGAAVTASPAPFRQGAAVP
jgi:shikimate 5-dehydrogenase